MKLNQDELNQITELRQDATYTQGWIDGMQHLAKLLGNINSGVAYNNGTISRLIRQNLQPRP